MNILITNDDGVYAPGIRTLYECLKEVATVTIIAPLEERSTTGHTVTLNHPLRIAQIEENIYGCSGYPADCVLLGIGHLLKNKKIDVVISGINRGANLAQDVFYSGTVAGAREASFHGHKSIAVSTVTEFINHEGEISYFTAGSIVKDLLSKGILNRMEQGELLNLNVPNVSFENIKGIRSVTGGKRIYTEDIDERVDCRGRPYFWIGGTYRGHDNDPASDCSAVDRKEVSLTSMGATGVRGERIEYWQKVLKEY